MGSPCPPCLRGEMLFGTFITTEARRTPKKDHRAEQHTNHSQLYPCNDSNSGANESQTDKISPEDMSWNPCGHEFCDRLSIEKMVNSKCDHRYGEEDCAKRNEYFQ